MAISIAGEVAGNHSTGLVCHNDTLFCHSHFLDHIVLNYFKIGSWNIKSSDLDLDDLPSVVTGLYVLGSGVTVLDGVPVNMAVVLYKVGLKVVRPRMNTH